MKWIIILVLAFFLFGFIRILLDNAKRNRDFNKTVGRLHKKKRGVKDLRYVAKCLEKGKKEKAITALEGIASQEVGLKELRDSYERRLAGCILLHLAVLGSCTKRPMDMDDITIEAPEYKNMKKAEEITGWLLECEKHSCAVRAWKEKEKPEIYRNCVYFVLALFASDGEERYERMKKAAEFKSDEARWWLLRNGLFEKAFPDEERQKKEYFNLYYAMKGKNDLWSGDVGAEEPLKEWMIREGGFPEQLLHCRRKELGEKTATEIQKDVVDALVALEKKGSSVGKETLERIEEQDRENYEELKEVIIRAKIVREELEAFNQEMEEFNALRKENEAAAKSGTEKSSSRKEFNLSSMPGIVYDSSNRQWKRRGIYGDHAVYYNNDGGEVTIYSAQVSSSSASTSAGTFHW